MLLMSALAWMSGAQTAPDNSPGGVYTCVDSKGRRLTADRPIPECEDREQRVLNPSGTLKKTVGPAMSAQDRASQEVRDRQAQEARERVADDRRRDQVLLARYPNRAAHDKERAAALAQIADVVEVANRRLLDLAEQRSKLDRELEFYKKDPSKAPAYLQHQVDDNALSVDQENRFLREQEQERGRVNQRFDNELARLRELWALSRAQ